jgi:GTP:adenosylcobinamide-phosphate guanylyltransferase
VRAIILAGSRPETDRLAAAFNVPTKALVPIAGEPMLSRVARTLISHPRIGGVTVLAQDPEALLRHSGTTWMAGEPSIGFERGEASVSASLAATLRRHAGRYPFLVTTADHPLLSFGAIDVFLAEAHGADVAVAVVEKRTLLGTYPESSRTWLNFRGGSYSGANLFLFGSARALPVLDLWRTIESRRKRARAVLRAFGPLMLAAAGLRLISLGEAIGLAGRRMGVSARAVALREAEACIDVDSMADHALAEQIVLRRRDAVV